MKRLIASTAVALALATSAYAASEMKPLATYEAAQNSQDILASNYIGMRVYATEDQAYKEWNADTAMNADATREWDDIGEINDVILGRDGQVKAVIVGIGGFIGIGERDVALPMDAIKMVSEQDDANDFFLVVQANKEMLEQAPEYTREADTAEMTEQEADTTQAASEQDQTTTAAAPAASDEMKDEETESAAADQATENSTETAATNEAKPEGETEQAQSSETMQPATEQADAGTAPETNTVTSQEVVEIKEPEAKDGEVDPTTTAATQPASDEAQPRMDDDGRQMLRQPEERQVEGYEAAMLEQLTADDLTGARVYGANDEDIGEVDQLILDDSGKITRAVLDIGGFLGLGEHEIALRMEELRIVRSTDGGSFRVYVDATQEELESQPEYEG